MTPLRSIREARFRVLGPNEVMLVLRAFLDETGHRDDPNTPVVGVAGAVASSEGWGDLARDWIAILDEFKVKSLHAVELAHFSGEFLGWNETKRRAFSSKLMSTIHRNVRLTVGGAVYMPMYWSLTNQQREFLIDPYFMGIQVCWQVAAREALEVGDGVEVFVEEQKEFAGKVSSFFHDYRQHLNGPGLVGTPDASTQLGDRLLGVSVQAKNMFVEFQVADWFAYEMNLEAKRQIDHQLGGPLRPERWPMIQFRKGGPGKGLVVGFTDAAKLLERLPATVGGKLI